MCDPNLVKDMKNFVISYKQPSNPNKTVYVGKNGNGMFEHRDHKETIHQFESFEDAHLWAVTHFIEMSLHSCSIEYAEKVIMGLSIEHVS